MRLMIAILLIPALAVGVEGCRSGAPGAAVDELTAALEGHYSPEEVEERLERAMVLYEVPASEDARRAAVAILHDMRETALEHGCVACDEMQILDRMIEAHRPGTQVSFEQAARAATAHLLREDLYEDRSSASIT
jgi:hypothetical protein